MTAVEPGAPVLYSSSRLTTGAIAEKLLISVNTVRTHVRDILTELRASRRNAAIRNPFRRGLLTSNLRGFAASTLVRPMGSEHRACTEG